MKKVIILLGLASAMSAFTGCSKDEPVAPEASGAQKYTINSVIAGGDTRTELDVESLKINWLSGDKIKVFTGNNMAFSEFTTQAGDGVFVGSVQPALTSKLSYVAVYPDGKIQTVYDPDAKQSVEALRVAIPKTQNYEAGKGPVASIPMVGIWGDEDQSVLFKPVGSALKLPIYVGVEGTKLTSVSFQFSGSVGAGEIAMKDWSLDEFGDYKEPSVYYTRNEFLYGEVSSNVTVKGDILPGTTLANAADVYAAVTPGDYKGGYSVEITDSEGNTMIKKKAAVSTIVALQAGKIQKIAPLEYVQKAPKFVVAEDPSDNTVVTATLASGEQLESDFTYQYWVEAYVRGMMSSSWQQASAKTNLTNNVPIKVSEINLSYLFDQPSDGDQLHFVIQATAADGTAYKRVYNYTYHKAAAAGIAISAISWNGENNACEIEFSEGTDVIKAADPVDVIFSLSGDNLPYEIERTLEELTTAGAKWATEWYGEFFSLPLTAFDMSVPIPVGNYKLKVDIYSGMTVVATSSKEFEVY